MNQLQEYVKISDMKEWLERDAIRILGKFPNDPLATGEEVAFFTEKVCMQVSFESFKEYYPKILENFREQNDLSNLICKKVELIMGGEGNTFQFKLTFVKP